MYRVRGPSFVFYNLIVFFHDHHLSHEFEHGALEPLPPPPISIHLSP